MFTSRNSRAFCNFLVPYGADQTVVAYGVDMDRCAFCSTSPGA